MFHRIFDALIHVLVVALKQAISEVTLCPAKETGVCPLKEDIDDGLGESSN